MTDLLSYAAVAGGTLVIAGAVRRTGELIAEGGWNLLRAETVERDNQRDNQRILSALESQQSQLKQKEDRIEKREQELSNVRGRKEELKERLSDFERITRSLKEESLARERLIERYWQPLHAVVICFAEQEDNGEGSGKWLRDLLDEQYNLHNLTGFTTIIPPAEVPSQLKGERNSRDKLSQWIEEDLYSEYPDAKSTICFASVVDLRNVYSRTDHKSEDRSHLFSTIDEELDLQEIFSGEDFSKLLASDGVNLSKVIEEGDIPFLASKVITADELDCIHENQEVIEEELGSPNLRAIADEVDVSTMARALSPYVESPDEVASSIKQEAEIWKRELY